MTVINLLRDSRPLTVEGLSKKTSLIVDVTQLILMFWTIGSSITHAGSISAAIITYILYTFYLIYAISSKNVLLQKLIIFGTSCGFLELFADHYAVVILDSLIYPKDEPMLWSSPLYMPFAWSNVLLQMGYLSLRLIKWKGVATSSLIIAVSGGIYVYFYENMAKSAGWWYYQKASMLFNTPYYISLAEVLLFITLPLMVYILSNSKNKLLPVLIGAIAGVWILIAAILAYTLFP